MSFFSPTCLYCLFENRSSTWTIRLFQEPAGDLFPRKSNINCPSARKSPEFRLLGKKKAGARSKTHILTRDVFHAVRVQREVPVEPAEREVRRFQFALGAPGRRGAVLVLQRVPGRRAVVVLDLVVMVQQAGRERRGHAELRVVQRAHVADGQFQLELAVRVREVSAVQFADRYVVSVPLGRTVRREFHLTDKRVSINAS